MIPAFGLRKQPTGDPPGDTAEAPDTGDAEQTQREQVIRCQRCGNEVADTDNVFSMSTEGPSGAFVNPHGMLFDVLTLRAARNVQLIGEPTVAHTWFAGYAWQVCVCAGCATHLGWCFVAAGMDRTPTDFYGLIRTALEGG